MARLALLRYPLFITGARDRNEARSHIQFGERLLHCFFHVVAGFGGHAGEDAERQCVVDHRLADVEHIDIIAVEHLGHRRRHAGFIDTRDTDQQQFFHGRPGEKK